MYVISNHLIKLPLNYFMFNFDTGKGLYVNGFDLISRNSCTIMRLLSLLTSWYLSNWCHLMTSSCTLLFISINRRVHDDVIKWQHFSALPVFCAANSPVTGEFPSQRPVTRSFDAFFDRAWINGWVNNREAGDLRRHPAHHGVNVMMWYYNKLYHGATRLGNDSKDAANFWRQSILLGSEMVACALKMNVLNLNHWLHQKLS